MLSRFAILLALVVLVLAGPEARAKPAPVSLPAITNVTSQRSISVFAGVLTGFSDSRTDLDTLHRFLTITDNNGNSFADTTTTVSSQPNALAVTGAGTATLAVSALTQTPPASKCNVTVGFTTTVPTDFRLKGSVTTSNLSESGPQVAGCRLTGPGVSVGFGRMTASGPWVLTGDFSGILQPGTYQFAVALETRTVSPPDSQATGFAGLDFLVSAFQGTKLGAYAGLGTAAPGTTPSHATEAAAAVIVKPKSRFLAKISQGGALSTVTGTIDAAGRFLGKDGKSPIALKRSGRPDAALTLVGNGGLDKITGTLVEPGTNATSSFDLDLAVYTSKKNPPAPLRNPAASLVGSYTVIFPPTAPAGQTLTPSIGTGSYPQGTGWATITVDKKGFAKLKGRLADGSTITAAAPLTKDDTWPFYVPLYGGKGSISGRVSFRPGMGSDLDGSATAGIARSQITTGRDSRRTSRTAPGEIRKRHVVRAGSRDRTPIPPSCSSRVRSSPRDSRPTSGARGPTPPPSVPEHVAEAGTRWRESRSETSRYSATPRDSVCRFLRVTSG